MPVYDEERGGYRLTPEEARRVQAVLDKAAAEMKDKEPPEHPLSRMALFTALLAGTATPDQQLLMAGVFGSYLKMLQEQNDVKQALEQVLGGLVAASTAKEQKH